MTSEYRLTHHYLALSLSLSLGHIAIGFVNFNWKFLHTLTQTDRQTNRQSDIFIGWKKSKRIKLTQTKTRTSFFEFLLPCRNMDNLVLFSHHHVHIHLDAISQSNKMPNEILCSMHACVYKLIYRQSIEVFLVGGIFSCVKKEAIWKLAFWWSCWILQPTVETVSSNCFGLDESGRARLRCCCA